MLEINLKDYIESETTSLIGKNKGTELASKLKFFEIKDNEIVTIIIPDEVLLINKNFFFWFFSDEITRLTVEQFKKKYNFICSEFNKERIEQYLNDYYIFSYTNGN